MIDWTNYITYLRFIAPMMINYTLMIPCAIRKSSGVIVPFRPPGYIFGIVWFILYCMIGWSWNMAVVANPKTIYYYNVWFSILVLSLSSWIGIYSCFRNKIGGIFAILFSLLFTFSITLSLDNGSLEQLCMIFLLIWLLFALLLNMFEVVMIHTKTIT